jgi:stress response protein YsnF
MDAIAEEAVVAKEAIVKEELVVRKDTTQRTETVDDTVRRTEVDVDKDSNTDLSGGRGF